MSTASTIWREIAQSWVVPVAPTLADVGVDTSAIVRSEVEPTSTNVVVLTPDGERTMFAYRGASAVLSADAITEATLDGMNWLHLSGYALLQEPQRSAALRAVSLADAAGVPISLDVPTVQWRDASESILEVLPQLALLMISEAGSAAIADDPTALLDAGCGMLALKRGARGCRILTRDEAGGRAAATHGAGQSLLAEAPFSFS